MKIVINNCFGGFSLSEEARERLGFDKWAARRIDRTSPELVKIVQEMGRAANGFAAFLKIVQIPDDVDWEIKEYDGWEWVSEKKPSSERPLRVWR